MRESLDDTLVVLAWGMVCHSPCQRSSSEPQNLIIPPGYDWGSGRFGEIADIRRRTYTSYWVRTELCSVLETIGLATAAIPPFLDRVFDEINNPQFGIDARRYEEIWAYLFDRAQASFPREFALSETNTSRNLCEGTKRILSEQCDALSASRFSTLEGTRRAVVAAASAALATHAPESMSRYSISLEKGGSTTESIPVPIDFCEDLFVRLINRPCRLVVLPGDILTSAADLLLYGQSLLEHWRTRLNTGASSAAEPRVTFLVNENLTVRNNNRLLLVSPTALHVRDLLALPQFEGLREHAKQNFFSLRTFKSKMPGTVLTDLDEQALQVLAEADCVLATGEINNLTLNGLQKDCFRIAPIRDFAHVFYAGIKLDLEASPHPGVSVLYAPAGVMPAIGWQPDRRSTLTAKQFADLRLLLPAPKWEELVEETRKSTPGASILDVARRSEVLSHEERFLVASIAGPSLRNRWKLAGAAMTAAGGSYRRISRPINKFHRRVAHILTWPAGQLRLGVRFAQSCPDWQGNPRSRMTFDHLIGTDPPLFGFSFLYFITRNQIDYFNRSNPHFILTPKFFGQGIDCVKVRIGSDDVLYPPLFNKGAIGMKSDGTPVFGRIRMPEKGSVTIQLDREGKRRWRFEWSCVNPQTLSGIDSASLFTPMAKHRRNVKRQAPHVAGETRSMFFVPDSRDHYHFVMINDRVLGVTSRRTEIPPFGTVLSVPKSRFSDEERMFIDCAEAGLHGTRRVVHGDLRAKWEFELPSPWDQAEWIMGGALLMVNDGRIEELRHSELSRSHSAYQIEGWALESSQRTQETPVETDLREARCTMGLTDDNDLFLMVIEGRANNRQGATHEETVQILREHFATLGTTIRYALDLDSASSVALALAHQGRFWLLNQTARGSDSKLGDTRFYNHLAFVCPANH